MTLWGHISFPPQALAPRIPLDCIPTTQGFSLGESLGVQASFPEGVPAAQRRLSRGLSINTHGLATFKASRASCHLPDSHKGCEAVGKTLREEATTFTGCRSLGLGGGGISSS